MKGYTPWQIEVDLPFEHCCKECDEHCLTRATDFKDVPLRQVFSDWIHGKKVRWQIPEIVIPHWCDKYKKQVDPEAKEPCFIWTGCHEEWIPDITATIEDGKVKVVFG